MSLGRPTVRKFIRESFVAGEPMTATGAVAARLKQLLKEADGLACDWNDLGPTDRDDYRPFGTISCRDFTPYYSSYAQVSLVVDAADRLFLHSYPDRVPVASPDEVLDFFRRCRERLTRNKGQEAKKKKVRHLQTAAIVAWVGQLAAKLRFDYSARPCPTKVDLAVRFGGKDVLEFAIPYAHFQDHLPVIESSLPFLRDLAKAGVAVQLRPRSAPQVIRYRNWVSPGGVAQPEEDE